MCFSEGPPPSPLPLPTDAVLGRLYMAENVYKQSAVCVSGRVVLGGVGGGAAGFRPIIKEFCPPARSSSRHFYAFLFSGPLQPEPGDVIYPHWQHGHCSSERQMEGWRNGGWTEGGVGGVAEGKEARKQ